MTTTSTSIELYSGTSISTTDWWSSPNNCWLPLPDDYWTLSSNPLQLPYITYETGTTTLNSNLVGLSDVSLNSKLNVQRDISANAGLYVGGATTLNSNLVGLSDVSLNGKLNVFKDISANAGLFVQNDVSLNSKLNCFLNNSDDD